MIKYDSFLYKICHSLYLNKTKLISTSLLFVMYLALFFRYQLDECLDIFPIVASGIGTIRLDFITISVEIVYNMIMVCLSIDLVLFYQKKIYCYLLRIDEKKLFQNIYMENIVMISIYTLVFYMFCVLICGFYTFDITFMILLLLKNIYIGSFAILLFHVFEEYGLLILCFIIVFPFFVNYPSFIYLIGNFQYWIGMVMLTTLNVLLYIINFVMRRYLYEYRN